jgi:hypothetical protein
MALFNCLKWPEMKSVALELISKMHTGHKCGQFSIPVVDFARVFAPGAPVSDLERVASRGAIAFSANGPDGGIFTLAPGPKALFELGREGLSMRVPERMSGRYQVRPEGFHIEFNRGEELEGCKRIVWHVCNRVITVDVSSSRVDVRLPSRLFDLCVEFD